MSIKFKRYSLPSTVWVMLNASFNGFLTKTWRFYLAVCAFTIERLKNVNVDHELFLTCDSSFPFHFQLVQNLFIPSATRRFGLNCTCQLGELQFVVFFALMKTITSRSLSREFLAIVILSNLMLTCPQESTCHDLKTEYKHTQSPIHTDKFTNVRNDGKVPIKLFENN